MKILFIILFNLVLIGYGFGMHSNGYDSGTKQGKYLKLIEYFDIRKKCREGLKINKQILEQFFRSKNVTYNQFKVWYDGQMERCVYEEFTK